MVRLLLFSLFNSHVSSLKPYFTEKPAEPLPPAPSARVVRGYGGINGDLMEFLLLRGNREHGPISEKARWQKYLIKLPLALTLAWN